MDADGHAVCVIYVVVLERSRPRCRKTKSDRVTVFRQQLGRLIRYCCARLCGSPRLRKFKPQIRGRAQYSSHLDLNIHLENCRHRKCTKKTRTSFCPARISRAKLPYKPAASSSRLMIMVRNWKPTLSVPAEVSRSYTTPKRAHV